MTEKDFVQWFVLTAEMRKSKQMDGKDYDNTADLIDAALECWAAIEERWKVENVK